MKAEVGSDAGMNISRIENALANGLQKTEIGLSKLSILENTGCLG